MSQISRYRPLEAEAAAKRFRAETNQLTGGSSGQATLEQQRLAALTRDLASAEAEEARSQAKLRAAQDQGGRGALALRVNQLRTERLGAQIGGLKETAVANSAKEARLEAYDATARAKRNELDRLQKQLEDNRTVVETARVPIELTIVSRGRPSDDPVFPKKGASTLLVMAATMMLGLALSIVKELMMPSAVPHNRSVSGERNASRGLTIKEINQSRPQSRVAARPAHPARSTQSHSAPWPAAPPPTTMREHARHYHEAKPAEGGHRLLIAGAADSIDPSDEAIELANELSDLSDCVIIVDWTLAGEPLLNEINIGLSRTLAELLADRAEFEDIVVALPDSNVHYIRTSEGRQSTDGFDEVSVNLVFDALDETYDHVIVVGRHDDAKHLFELIQGRFDAGLIVHDAARACRGGAEGFLGFAVEGLDVIHYDRTPASASHRAHA